MFAILKETTRFLAYCESFTITKFMKGFPFAPTLVRVVNFWNVLACNHRHKVYQHPSFAYVDRIATVSKKKNLLAASLPQTQSGRRAPGGRDAPAGACGRKADANYPRLGRGFWQVISWQYCTLKKVFRWLDWARKSPLRLSHSSRRELRRQRKLSYPFLFGRLFFWEEKLAVMRRYDNIFIIQVSCCPNKQTRSALTKIFREHNQSK